MVKTQTKVGRGRRFFGWFGHHKVTAVFVSLLVAFMLFWVGSWVVLQIQIHFERERFLYVDKVLTKLDKSLPGKARSNSCSYTSDGAVFANKSLGCSLSLTMTYKGVSKGQAVLATEHVKSVIEGQGISLTSNDKSLGTNDLAIYTFDLKRVGCALTSTYYDDGIPAYDRYSTAPKSGNVAYIEIDCGGSAKAEYFPVDNG